MFILQRKRQSTPITDDAVVDELLIDSNGRKVLHCFGERRRVWQIHDLIHPGEDPDAISDVAVSYVCVSSR